VDVAAADTAETETYQTTRDDALRAMLGGDIDPVKHAGEGFFSTDEYFPQDIRDPWVLGDVMEQDGYYPAPQRPPKKWPPQRPY